VRKSAQALLTLLLLSGCETAYSGVYGTASCGLTKSQSMEIATDISQSLGAPVKVTENSEGFRTIVIALPAEARPGLGIIPYARIVETNQ
jgi:hypothetical protein